MPSAEFSQKQEDYLQGVDSRLDSPTKDDSKHDTRRERSGYDALIYMRNCVAHSHMRPETHLPVRLVTPYIDVIEYHCSCLAINSWVRQRLSSIRIYLFLRVGDACEPGRRVCLGSSRLINTKGAQESALALRKCHIIFCPDFRRPGEGEEEWA